MLPGIDTAQVLRASVKGGPRLAYLTLFGIMAGVYFWGITGAIGVSAVLLASETLYRIFQYAGAAYLLYLGATMIRDSRKSEGLNISATPDGQNSIKEFMRAFMVTFTNPKNGAFYIAVIPQFLPHDMNPVVGGFFLASIHNASCLIWFTGVIALTNTAKNFFARPKVGQVIERVSGLALLVFALSMVLETL
jgi:threonine/homoserine/homoserine lactone efflux protein